MLLIEPVSFAAEFEVTSLDRRRSPRAPVSLDAKIGRGGFDRALCKIVNVSLHGARLQTYTSLKPDSHIWLTLPKLGQVSARVIWADEFEAGCEFQTPLTEEAFSALIAA